MSKFLLFVFSLTILAIPAAAFAQEGDAPAKFISESNIVTLSAKVVAIDHKTRVIVLEGPEGNTITTKVDDDVKNLKKVKKGDMVNIQLYESLSISLQKNEKKEDIRTETKKVVVNTTLHKKPVKIETETVTSIADVTKVNKKKGTVTLIGVKGMPVEVKVQDPANLDIISKGDQIKISYTESVAFEVTKK